MRFTAKMLAPVCLALGLSSVIAACDGDGGGSQQLECGPGTMLSERQCVVDATNGNGNGVVCGAGTVLDAATGTCVANTGGFTCGPGTEASGDQCVPAAFARVQIIHNVADPAVAAVDVYVNGSALCDALPFGKATGFLDVFSGIDLTIALAPDGSTSAAEAVATFGPFNFAPRATSVLIVSGVADPAGFAPNPDARDVGLQLLRIDDAHETAEDPVTAEVRFFHGVTDLGAVDVVANGALAVDDARFGDSSEPIAAPPGITTLDVILAGTNTHFRSYQTPPLAAGASWLIVASGFRDSDANGGGPGIALRAFPPSGGDGIVLPIAARAQFINNSPDPAAAILDLWAGDVLVADDIPFRSSSPLITLPAGVPLTLSVNATTSTGPTDKQLFTVTPTLVGDAFGANVFIATGVLSSAAYSANPDGASTAFTLVVSDGARQRSLDNSFVDLRIFHGATDAPAVDVIQPGVDELGDPIDNVRADDVGYLEFGDEFLIFATTHRFHVTNAAGTITLATFDLDLSSLAGVAVTLVVSGFLTPADDPLAGGGGPGLTLVAFPATGGAVVAVPAAL